MMLLVLSFLVWTSNAASGCGSASPYGLGSAAGVIVSDSMNRTFRVFTPASYNFNTRVPITFFFHGGGGTGRIAELAFDWNSVASLHNFIMVYPDGDNNVWNAGLCCGSSALNNVKDVLFFSDLLTKLESEFCIDSTRVFVTGMSNGGMFANRLACEMSSRITAVVTSSSCIMVLPSRSCTPARAIPYAEMHSLDDLSVPWDGGKGCGPSVVGFSSVQQTMTNWIVANGCNCAFQQGGCNTTTWVDGNGACVQFGTCNAPTILCTLGNASGHVWPGRISPTSPESGCNTNDATFRANVFAWNFFSAATPLPSATTATSSTTSATTTKTSTTRPSVGSQLAVFSLLALITISALL